MSEDRKLLFVWASLLVLVLGGWVAVIGTTGAAATWAIKLAHHNPAPISRHA